MTRSTHDQKRHLGALTLVATNKTGAALAIGDVVVVDTTNDTAVTTTTSAQSTKQIGVVAEPIASNATGHIAIAGWVPLVNVTASVTRGHYAETSTTAKKASANSARRDGSFAVFFTGGTTPAAWLFGVPDWSTGGVGGGGSLTVEGTSGTPSEASVTVLRVAEYTVNGSGDVTILPAIQGTGDGVISFDTTAVSIYSPDMWNIGEGGAVYADNGGVQLEGRHTAADLTNEGVHVYVGDGARGLWFSQKSSDTVQIHDDDSGGTYIEFSDNGADNFRHRDQSGVIRTLATMESRKGAGSATVASGSTTVTVTHGAGYTPAAEDIMVTPTNSPTNDPGHWWVDTIGGTTFKINVRANPGVSGASFAWRVDR